MGVHIWQTPALFALVVFASYAKSLLDVDLLAFQQG